MTLPENMRKGIRDSDSDASAEAHLLTKLAPSLSFILMAGILQNINREIPHFFQAVDSKKYNLYYL